MRDAPVEHHRRLAARFHCLDAGFELGDHPARDRPVVAQPVDIGANGRVVTKPFFWTAAGVPPHAGIPYRLEQDGKVIDEGRLRAKFRVASIFWPPFAAIYWPMGFNPDITYNLVDGTQQ